MKNRVLNGVMNMRRDTDVLLDEKRIFKPSVETVERAHVKNWETELEKGKDFKKYWAEKAEQFEWFQQWDEVLDESNKPFYKWFVNGKINLTYNAVDRWLDTDKRNQVAILYTNERGHELINFHEFSDILTSLIHLFL